MLLAIEREEVEGVCGLNWPTVKIQKPDWVEEKKIIAIGQIGLEKDPDLPDAPLIQDWRKTGTAGMHWNWSSAPGK